MLESNMIMNSIEVCMGLSSYFLSCHFRISSFLVKNLTIEGNRTV